MVLSPSKRHQSLEEEFSANAPDHLLDPVTFNLFRTPVVASSGETYDLETLKKTKVDPTTREDLGDVSKLPVNRAIKRQVDAYIQKQLDAVASRLAAPDTQGRHDQLALEIMAATRFLMLSAGRSDDCCLNGKRAILASLSAIAPLVDSVKKELGGIALKELDAALVMHDELPLLETLVPGYASRAPPPASPVATNARPAPPGNSTLAGDGSAVSSLPRDLILALGEAQAAAAAEQREPCGACSQPVVRLHAEVADDGKVYHPACFVCSACQKALAGGGGKHGVHAGAVVCAGCLTDLLCERCPVCGKGVSAGVTHQRRVYHHACFEAGSHEPAAAAGRVGAGKRAQLKCGGGGGVGCGNPVDSGVEALGQVWCTKCWACSCCFGKLEGSTFYPNEAGDKPMCSPCYRQVVLPKCEGCGKPAETWVTAERFKAGKKWHQECFKCSSCACALSGSFQHKDGAMFCDACFADKHLPRCGGGGEGGCGRPVNGGVEAINRSWCASCWACKRCLKPICESHFHVGEGATAPTCVDCWARHVLPKCAACGLPAEKWITAEEVHPGKKWHQECFRCSACKGVLEGEFQNKEGALFCKACFISHFCPRCAGCSKNIQGRQISALSRVWHAECFTCVDCGRQITSQTFHKRTVEGKQGERGVCEQCHTKSLPKCEACKKTITTSASLYKGKPMHKECFKCSNCRKPIASSFYEKGDQVLCVECAKK